MGKEYSKKNIGMEYLTAEGYSVKIVDGGSKPRYCTVQIEDWTGEARLDRVRIGKVRYPYQKSVCGVGYLGEGNHKSQSNGKSNNVYFVWSTMIRRCYDPNVFKKLPTYINCSVDPRWHNFQVFAEWYYNNSKKIRGIKFHLDKDLLIDGNKVYSPETCVILPARINLFLANKKSNNVSGFIGVSFDSASKKWRATCHDFHKHGNITLGCCDDPEKASLMYLKGRSIQAEHAKNYMRSLGIYSEEVIQKIK